jgi:hemin uptake protein HemP
MGAPAPSRPADVVRDAMPTRSPLSNALALRRIDSHELLGAAHEIEIVHGNHLYRLRLTALGKLILTK